MKKNAFLLDVLAFSFLPSYFQFFMLSSSWKEFLDFLHNRVDNELYPTFARVLFVIPAFVHFIRETIYPILQRMIDDRVAVIAEPRAFLQDVYNAWRNHAALVPTVISKFMRNDDPPDDGALRALFWEPFVRDPRRFLGCEFTCDVGAMLSPILSVLDDFSGFAQLLANAGGQVANDSISEQAAEADACSFSVRVVSSFDLEIGARLTDRRFKDAFRTAMPDYGVGEGRFPGRPPGPIRLMVPARASPIC
jgi:hypothetical protein